MKHTAAAEGHTIRHNKDIEELTHKNVSHLRREERIYMIKVMETTKFLARQGKPFRGNTDFESNFTEALLLRGTEDPQLKQHVFSTRSDNMLKYMHQDFQNELVDLCLSKSYPN